MGSSCWKGQSGSPGCIFPLRPLCWSCCMLVWGTRPAKNLLWHKNWRALCWFSSLDWHSVGQGHSGAVKWKLQDAFWGQGQLQGAGHPSWQCLKVDWLHCIIKSQLPRPLQSCVSCNGCPSVPVWEVMYWNLFNKCNRFSSSGANRAGYYYYHLFRISHFFFSVSHGLSIIH